MKPANVKLTLDGDVKVLDYGLAKALGDNNAASPDDSLSPTLTRATGVGVLLETAGYMAPEQAKGKPVDKRDGKSFFPQAWINPPTFRDALGERGAFDELEDERVLLEPIDRRHVRMIERREYLRLALEAFHPLGILREILRKHFDHDVTLQFGVARTVDLTHAPNPNESDDLVATKLRAFRKRHRARLYVQSRFAVQLNLFYSVICHFSVVIHHNASSVKRQASMP